MKSLRKIFLFLMIMFWLAGAVIIAYPLISDLINEHYNLSRIDKYNNNVDTMSEKEINDIFAKAREYNSALALSHFENHEGFDVKFKEIMSSYNEILNFEDGLICYVEIPEINVKLPVYHGESEEVLKKGAAHLEQTSFPIGEKNSHACISAHSGYPTQKFFDDLDELEIYDTFYINILNRKLKYQIYDIEIVKPEDAKNLKLIDERDTVTLVTCTPYGINSHRLLVHAERVYDNESKKQIDKYYDEAETERPTKNNLKLTVLFVLLGSTLVFVIFIIFRLKRKHKEVDS